MNPTAEKLVYFHREHSQTRCWGRREPEVARKRYGNLEYALSVGGGGEDDFFFALFGCGEVERVYNAVVMGTGRMRVASMRFSCFSRVAVDGGGKQK